MHILKRDASQIGINAREALKFLDRVTSGKDNLSETSIQLQGPDDRFQTWEEVEAQLKATQGVVGSVEKHSTSETAESTAFIPSDAERSSTKASTAPRTTNALSQLLLDKLNFAKEPETMSNASTPPTSPSSSNLQSTKNSPEVLTSKPVPSRASAAIADTDSVIVPHAYRPLINSAVFLLKNQGEASSMHSPFMLTNDAEMGAIARKFSLAVKNIHQLRAVISSETQEAKNQSRYQQKHSPKPSLSSNEIKPKTLFSYEEDEDEEVVFRPRSSRSVLSSRGRLATKKSNTELRRSVEPLSTQPPIPIEEIDPNSFDRGAFSRARPATPTKQIEAKEQIHANGRVNGRGGHKARSPGKGTSRGQFRGSGRGSARGSGKLFVP